VTRRLRLLRAHGLIHKVPKTHRYQVSPQGRKVITAVLAARQASTELLVTMAA
jgi:DNA-binding HxlR family transcriptional regulator